MLQLEQYIRQAAIQRGIDPDIAVRVAQSEGGLNNPFRHGEGPAPRSQAPGYGPTENSFGPFQLYVSGNGAGLGDRAVNAGIDPRQNWQGGVDYALDEASRKGWGQWYGAKKQGITGMMGIGGPRDPATAPSPYAGMPDGPKGQEAYAPQPSMGSPYPGTAVAAHPSQQPSQQQPSASYIPQSVADFANSKTGGTLGNIFGTMALAQQPKPLEPLPIRGPTPEQANALLSLLQSLKQRPV